MTNARLLALGTFALLLPVSIENPAFTDSARVGGETRVTVVGAIGHYAVIDRGCEGQVIDSHPHKFEEAGIEAQHRLPSGVALGLRGGVVRDRGEERLIDYSVYPPTDIIVPVNDDFDYFNPFVGYEGRSVGLGVGWILSSGDFGNEGNRTVLPWSAHIRLGATDGPYFRLGVMEGFPLYSGGGYADLGVGLRPNRMWDVYTGVTGGPYDGPGLMLKVDRRVQKNVAVILRGRVGNSGGEPQNGVGLGLTYVSTPPIEPRRAPDYWREGKTIESSWGLAPKRPRAEKAATPSGRKPPAPQRPPEYGTYQHVDSLPVLSKRTPCAPPDTIREAGTGTVMVAALIGEDGRVREARMVQSIPVLDAAAMECVRQWTFRPAMRSGWPVAYWMALPVTFEP